MLHLALLLIVCLSMLPTLEGQLSKHPSEVLSWVALLPTASWLIAYITSSALIYGMRTHSLRRSLWFRLYSLARSAHFALVSCGFLYSLLSLGWAELIRHEWGMAGTILLDEILILAPFLISIILGWICFSRVEIAFHRRGEDNSRPLRWYILTFQLRHYLGFVIAPMMIFMGLYELLLWAAPSAGHSGQFQYIATILLGILLTVSMPWILKKLWGAKSLPSGPLRTCLELAAERLKFRHTDILLWKTPSGLANAMVTGLLPWPRYVILSDGLINGLSQEEIEAVFGHEIGHIRHHHILVYLCFMVLSLTLVSFPMSLDVWDGMDLHSLVELGRTQWGPLLVTLVTVGSYFWVVFGFLSRKCERQADVFGCKAISCPDAECGGHNENTPFSDGDTLCRTGIKTFIRALENVGALNGIERERPSWRHSSIAQRVEFLEKLKLNPSSEGRFQARLAWQKYGLLTTLAGLAVVMAWYEAYG